MSKSKLISSDSHFYEPPDLWERWIEPKFRDRAPFVAHEDNTDQWYADGDWKFGDFNLTNAGLRFENPELLKFEGRYEDVLLGGLNPHAHVKEMDVDGISAGVLYPSHALSIWGTRRWRTALGLFQGLQQLAGRRLVYSLPRPAQGNRHDQHR